MSGRGHHRFGGPVQISQPAAGWEGREQPADGAGEQRLAAGQQQTQPAVSGPWRGRPGQLVDQSGGQVGHGDPQFGQCPRQVGGDLSGMGDHHGGPDVQCREDLFVGGVEAGRGQLQYPVGVGQLSAGGESGDVGEECPVGQLDALRSAGRAGGVDQQRDPVRVGGRRWLGCLRLRVCCAGDGERREIRRYGRGGVGGQHQPRPGLGEDQPGAGRRMGRIQRYQHGAGTRRCQQ